MLKVQEPKNAIVDLLIWTRTISMALPKDSPAVLNFFLPEWNTCQSADSWSNSWKCFGIQPLQSYLRELPEIELLPLLCVLPVLILMLCYDFSLPSTLSLLFIPNYSVRSSGTLFFRGEQTFLHPQHCHWRVAPHLLTSFKLGSSLRMPLSCSAFRWGFSGSQLSLGVLTWGRCSAGNSHWLADYYSTLLWHLYQSTLHPHHRLLLVSLVTMSHSLTSPWHPESCSTLDDFDVDMEESPHAKISQFLKYFFSTAVTLSPGILLHLEHKLPLAFIS